MGTINTGWVTCQVCGSPASFHETWSWFMVEGSLNCPSCGLYVSWNQRDFFVEQREPDPELAAYLEELSQEQPPEEEDDLGESFWEDVLCRLDDLSCE